MSNGWQNLHWSWSLRGGWENSSKWCRCGTHFNRGNIPLVILSQINNINKEKDIKDFLICIGFNDSTRSFIFFVTTWIMLTKDAVSWGCFELEMQHGFSLPLLRRNRNFLWLILSVHEYANNFLYLYTIYLYWMNTLIKPAKGKIHNKPIGVNCVIKPFIQMYWSNWFFLKDHKNVWISTSTISMVKWVNIIVKLIIDGMLQEYAFWLYWCFLYFLSGIFSLIYSLFQQLTCMILHRACRKADMLKSFYTAKMGLDRALLA